MKKKMIGLLLALVMVMSIPMSAFASSPAELQNVNQVKGSSTGWTAWMETGRYNSSAKLEDLSELGIRTAITGGISGWIAAGYAAIDIAKILGGKNLYFTTIKYSRFDGTGLEQYYSVRKIYDDKKRKNKISEIKTEVKETWHSMLMFNEDQK